MTRFLSFRTVLSARKCLKLGRLHNENPVLLQKQTNAFINHSKQNLSTSSVCYRRKDDDGYGEEQPPPRPADDPLGRTFKILKHDVKSIYDKTQPPLLEFSSHVDLLIIGGGVMGSTFAYMIKERTPKAALKVMVIERDPTYSQSATAMSVGGLRHHFTLQENIEMAQFSREFLRKVPEKLACGNEPAPDIQYHPYGFLVLADEEHADELQESWLMQKELGIPSELLTAERLKEKFPWMNTTGVEVALHGQEGEGWFDAWAFHFGMKRKAIHLGTEYIQAEVIGFDFEDSTICVAGMDPLVDDDHIRTNRAIVRTPSGEKKTIDFAHCLIAAGHESATVAEMARIGRGPGLLSVPLPVEPRRRYVYCMQAPEGPGIDCPIVANTDGVYFRREGYAGHFVAGHAPPLGETLDSGDLGADYKYFDDVVWPSIATRVPGFRNVKLNSAWAGYYDYNRFDQNGIIGPHPYYPNIYFATGFSGHGIQHAPAIARATMEMMLDGEFRTIDLHKYLFERFLIGYKVKEGIVN